MLGFLREHQPDWVKQTSPKVINPEVLLREDLEPALLERERSFYGLTLNLDFLQADHTADEAKNPRNAGGWPASVKPIGHRRKPKVMINYRHWARTAENLKKQGKGR